MDETIDWTAWGYEPWPLYKRLRDETPVFWDEPNRTFVLTRHDDVYGVLADHRRFSSVPLGILEGRDPPSSQIRVADEPRHSFMRKIVAPLFSPGAMRRLEDYLRGVVRELVDEAGGPEVEVSSALAMELPARVAFDLIGLPLEQHARFRELIDTRLAVILGRASDGTLSDKSLTTLARVRSEMWEIVAPVIESRRREPQHDAISAICEAQASFGRDDITDDLFLNMLLELVTAGLETTQHLIEMLLDHLADHPELWAALREDRSLVPGAIEEMLRWKSPVQALGRRSIEEAVFHGVTIPKDSWLTVVYGSANRDEREFEEPDEYRLGRDLKRHVAFSAGVHYCPGAPVTRSEVRVLMDELLDRYASIERAGESAPWPDFVPTKPEKFIGLRRVPVRFVV